MLKRINKYIKTEEDEESEKSPSNIMQDVNEKMLKMKLKREKQKYIFINADLFFMNFVLCVIKHCLI